jgi:aminoglycoside 3-N-acetyltransferase
MAVLSSGQTLGEAFPHVRTSPAEGVGAARVTLGRLRPLAGRIKRALDRRRLSEAAFRTLLNDLGMVRGSVVLLHTSLDALRRRIPGLGPLAFIRLFQDVVGPEGALAMLTLPFTGRQMHYVEQNPVFDVERTPSRSGIISEVFRRLPDVHRSLHPACPVAAWGRDAKTLVAGHHLGTTFGTSSPFMRMAERGGYEIGLGTSFDTTFSVLHVPEEVDPRTRAYAYDPVERTLRTVDRDRSQIEYRMRALRPTLAKDFATVERLLREDGTIRAVSRAGLYCLTGRMDRIVSRSMDLIRDNHFLFGAAPNDAAAAMPS